ncbi:MAG: flippase, partial [Ruminococcaceae bacterium]|nr:flippase [Oscillospiraceae bacterium]
MEKPSVKKNFVYNIIYQLLAIVVPLITSPYISRVLGADMIGVHSWTHSVVFYFMIFALLGVSNYGNRSIAAARAAGDPSEAFCSIYACQLISSAAMVLLYVLYLVLFPVKYPLIAGLQIFFVLSSALDVTWFFNGLEEFRITVIRSCAVRLAGLAGIFIFVRTADDLWKYTLIVSGTTFLGSVLLWPPLLRRVRLTIPKPSQLVPHIKPILVLFLPVLCISIFANMDKYMIGRMSTITESGFYENTDKIIGIPKAVI